MRNIRINFVDFWDNFQKTDNYFYHLLSTKYDVIVDEQDPDILFCSLFGNEKQKYRNHRAKKIFYTGENRFDHSYKWDLSFSFEPTNGTNFYFPLWIMFLNWFRVPENINRDISYLHDIEDLASELKNVDSVINEKTNFCSFIVRNPNFSLRNQFCIEMQKRKSVDCPGEVLNNHPPIGGRGDQVQKIDFLKSYKFNIAFENSFSPGYVTEKIIQPMFVRCVPIYWGGTEAFNYFNHSSFIWCGDCETMEQAIDRVIKLDNDRDLYIETIRNPVIKIDRIMSDFSPHKIIEQIERVL